MDGDEDEERVANGARDEPTREEDNQATSEEKGVVTNSYGEVKIYLANFLFLYFVLSLCAIIIYFLCNN